MRVPPTQLIGNYYGTCLISKQVRQRDRRGLCYSCVHTHTRTGGGGQGGVRFLLVLLFTCSGAQSGTYESYRISCYHKFPASMYSFASDLFRFTPPPRVLHTPQYVSCRPVASGTALRLNNTAYYCLEDIATHTIVI